MGGGISWNITLSLRRNRFGLGFLSIQFSKIAGIKTQREIPMNQKSNLASGKIVRTNPREEKAKREITVLSHHSWKSEMHQKGSRRPILGQQKKRKKELLRAELNPIWAGPSGRLLILKSQH